MKTRKVELWGGFHRVPLMIVRWNGKSLTKRQVRRIQAHFCPGGDCLCGGILRDASSSLPPADFAKFLDQYDCARLGA